MADHIPQPLPAFLAEHCDAVARDAQDRDWFLHLHSERQTNRRGGTEGVVWLAVSDSHGDWAVCDAQIFELEPGEGESWLSHPDRASALDWMRAIVLGRFCDWLTLAGYGRNQAAAIRATVINCEGLPADTQPVWEHQGDAERHRALCAVMGVSDPLA